jgi:hypothetical protein
VGSVLSSITGGSGCAGELPNTASELANTTVGEVPSAAGLQQRARGVDVAAHAEVEVGFAFAADGGGQVEDQRVVGAHHLRCRIAAFQKLVEVADDGAHSWVRRQRGGRCDPVDQGDGLDGLRRAARKGKFSLFKQVAGKPGAQEAGAAGDDDVHMSFVSVISVLGLRRGLVPGVPHSLG